jgi:excisionase family DNA binding protein
MTKRANGRRIKTPYCYTVFEAAERLGVSVATVRQWVRDGLPIMKAKRPFLISGGELRHFLDHRTGQRRSRLAPNQLYCLACKEPRKPYGLMVDYVPQTAKTGRLVGLCEVCDAKCNRMISRAALTGFQQIFIVEMREP